MLNRHLSRRSFFAGTSLACLAAGVSSARASTRTRTPIDDESPLPLSFPSQDPDAVREIVGAAHFDLDKVKSMVTARPALAKASWDWGFGDWESALGAASHVGRPDIASVLIDNGARPNLFTFAMLGQLDAVRAIIEANPGIQRIHGPHGITLLSHANFGGDAARPVVDYLHTLGDADNGYTNEQLSDDDKDRLLGEYQIEYDGAPPLSVAKTRDGSPGLKVGGDFARTLFHQGGLEFHPSGAPAVRINFRIENDIVRSLTIHDGDLIVTAQRIGG